MAKTRAQLRADLSKEIFDYWVGECTSNGTTTTVVDTSLTDKLRTPAANQWVYFTSGDNIGEARRVFSYDSSTTIITVSRAFSNATASGDDYELHSFDPDDLHYAIEHARTAIYSYVFRELDDETVYTRHTQNKYTLPIAFRDLYRVYLLGGEIDLGTSLQLLENGGFENWDADDDPADWGAGSELTLAKEEDFVWEGGYSCKCTSTTSAGYLPQTITDGTNYKGQMITFDAPVYCETASRVTLGIHDGSAVLSAAVGGNYHGGGGWERLTVSSILPSTATELTVRIINDAGSAHVFYVDGNCHVWAARRRPSKAGTLLLNWNVVGNVLTFPYFPTENRFLRLVGTTYLTTVTSDTDEMEIYDPQTQILYAAAALYLQKQLLQQTPGQTQPTAAFMKVDWEQELERRKRRHGMTAPALKRNSPDFGISG